MVFLKGKIVRWNYDRGFGFIHTEDSNNDVFAHITEFEKGYKKPKDGDLVKFKVKTEKGKKRAVAISKLEPKSLKAMGSIVMGMLIVGALIAALYYLVIDPKLHPAYEEMGFSCNGKTYCSQMASCDEAKYHLAHCPNVKIDGNGDGVPCEKQLCNGMWQ